MILNVRTKLPFTRIGLEIKASPWTIFPAGRTRSIESTHKSLSNMVLSNDVNFITFLFLLCFIRRLSSGF